MMLPKSIFDNSQPVGKRKGKPSPLQGGRRQQHYLFFVGWAGPSLLCVGWPARLLLCDPGRLSIHHCAPAQLSLGPGITFFRGLA